MEVLEDSDILANIEKVTWVQLPKWYVDKIRSFMVNNKTLGKDIAAKFTEDFIIKEMKSNWWISKENQLLFVYCAIWYNYNEDFYKWDDWDDNRMSEFENTIDIIEDCQSRYREEFMSYMQQRSAEAQQRSAEAQQRSAEAQQRSAEAQQRSAEAQQRSAEAQQRSAEAAKEIMKQDSTRVKERMVEFYDIYVEKPSTIKQDDLNFMKESTKGFISSCKKYWIDYKAILLKEVWDKRRVEQILEFYEVE